MFLFPTDAKLSIFTVGSLLFPVKIMGSRYLRSQLNVLSCIVNSHLMIQTEDENAGFYWQSSQGIYTMLGE